MRAWPAFRSNPGGVVQMISLGNSRTGLVLGFEDLPATSGDADGNELLPQPWVHASVLTPSN